MEGIKDKLSYLQFLGVNCLWLSPVFESGSHHGYDVMDYFQVARRFGGNLALKKLIEEAHERGMRVILDFVPNHCSREHLFFQKAISDIESPYQKWFIFNQWPNQFETFLGVDDLPKINLQHPEAREHILNAAEMWVRKYGVDGFRLDFAKGPWHDFWTDFRARIKSVKHNCFTVGEIVDEPELCRTYEGLMDGCLDFLFLQEARRFFGYQDLDAVAFDRFLTHQESFYSPGFIRPTFLDNHDLNRFLWITKGDKRRLKLAAACQFTLSQPPIIYYGTEVGLSQQDDVRTYRGNSRPELAREPMVWGKQQDKQLLSYYRKLCHIRNQHPALRRGERIPLLVHGSGIYCYAKYLNGDVAVIVLNTSLKRQSIVLDLRRLERLNGLVATEFEDCLNNLECSFTVKGLEIVMPELTAAILVPKV